MRSSESAGAAHRCLHGGAANYRGCVLALDWATCGKLGTSRPLLLLVGFAALPIRGALLAFVSNPYALTSLRSRSTVCQAAVLGVMVPLIIAEVSRGTGHFNLGQGVVGSGIGIGASLSTTMAG